MRAFAVLEDGKLKLDTVYSSATLSKMHWLAYSTGDYDDSDFYMLPGRLDSNVEFEKYPEANIVEVAVSIVANSGSHAHG